jgi:hypothetical protein
MFIPKPNDSGDFTPPPAGTHLAVCYRFIDLGTQEGSYQGKVTHQRKVLIGWELPDELMEDGKPFIVQQRYTWSMSEKANLRKHLESWRGKAFEERDFGPGGFNIKNVLGKPCVLTIVHETKDGKTYANISSVGKPMKGMAAPEPINPVVYFSLEDYSETVYASLSDGLKTTIAKSPEFHRLATGGSDDDLPERRDADLDDEVPF